jgi:uncharacterized protein (TIGR03118 family)
MIRRNFLQGWALFVMGILCVALMPQRTHAASGYIQHNLVSDVPLLADFTDPNLVNPWGISFTASSPFWLCDQRTGLSTVYSTAGGVFAVSATVVTVPAGGGKTTPGPCTGTVVNTSGSATAPVFSPASGVNGSFLFATGDGTISSRSGSAAVIKVDNTASGAVYTGLAILNSASANYLYVANFHAGTIEVYDGNFAKATLTGSFTDLSVPAGFAPFNIQNLGGKLYVTYAKQDSTKTIDVAGVGNGYVAVFDTNGNLIQHLISNGPLNSPWGIQIAPPSFGAFANDLLVGNFEDGLINAFDPSTGKLIGTMQDPSGNPIANPGLWALQFGNGGSGGFATTLYITVGVSVEGSGIQSHGLFAALTTTAPPSVPANGIVNGASFAGCCAPGSIAAIFGTNLTDNGSACLPPACSPTFRSDKRLATTLAGAQVEVNGVPVPMLYASPVQLGIQIPAELTAGSTASVQVIVDGQASAANTLNVSAFSPGIFAGAVTHANGAAVTAANAAAVGETVTIYATGIGQTSSSVLTGEVPAGTVTTVTTPTVTIGGISAQVPFSGLSGFVGVNQINAVVPSGVQIGTTVPVVVSIGGQQSNTVNIATKSGS